MNHAIKILFVTVAIAVLCSCGEHQERSASPIVGDFSGQLQEDQEFSNRLQDDAENEIVPVELTVLEILHNFNWMGDDGNYQNEFADKPFLKMNNDGSSGAAGVLDINRDGEMEFLMAVYHVPRGIPSVEVFAVRDNKLVSIGGFFEDREDFFERQDELQRLSYYRDSQGRLLFLQRTEAGYGGHTKTLVATYTEDLRNVPIASFYRYYYDDERFPNKYYVFPEGMDTECTYSFLCGVFPEYEGEYDATEEEYNAKISEFMDSLTWVEDVEYSYSVYYHLYNSHELTNEIRGKEISEGLMASPPKDYHTPEEMKKTSDMVADALYAAYCEQGTHQ